MNPPRFALDCGETVSPEYIEKELDRLLRRHTHTTCGGNPLKHPA
jgi:hypothetical protein